jgi:carboxyl-terminal processing protease
LSTSVYIVCRHFNGVLKGETVLQQIILSFFFITFFLVSCFDVYVAAGAVTEFEQKRAELLSKMISQQMVTHHYLHRPFDDELSQKIFNSYLKQLDPGKRYFLKSDIQILSGYSLQMDDEIQAGSLGFPLLAEEILRRRVKEVQEIFAEMAQGDIDFYQDTVLQTDTKKLDYCQTELELRVRWHKVISHESISKYLDLMEIKELDQHVSVSGTEQTGEDIADNVNKDSEQTRKAAVETVLQANRVKLQEIIDRNTMAQINQYFAIIVQAFDHQSTYMPPKKHEDFTINLRGSFEGIGAILKMVDNEIKVAKIIDGGAAARQKQLQVGDSILKVGQEDEDPIDTKGMKIRDVIALVRGEKGTEVRLTVKKTDGSIKVIPITRDIVQLKDKFVQTTPLLDSSNNKFYGYMKIPSFYRDFEKTGHGGNGRNVSDDVRKGLEELKAYGIQGLVLDLRNNPGGANIDATHVGGLFIQYGPIQQSKYSDGRIKPSYDFDRATIYQGPMVVLVNEYSASSSEVLAGAMQDLKRALIVGGAHTYGKGTGQYLLNLDQIASLDGIDLSPYKPLGLLKITTEAVFRINGEAIQQRGIIPDIVLPSPPIMSNTIESHYENSLQWGSIEPINIENLVKYLDFRKIDLAALLQASRKRVNEDKFFQELIKASEKEEQYQSQTEVVLNVDKIAEQRKILREKHRSTKTLWGYEHAGHGGQVSSPTNNGLQGEEIKEFHVKRLQSDPYIKESLSLLKDMGQ